MADTTVYSPVTSRLRHTANNIATGVRDYRTYLKTRAELNALSDRELSDLGLSRFDLPRVAREAVYG